ncbi:hypothetical protein HAX54_034908, partial [Datura stramonium]|nr:hypothetical protein [Datura stramonium]
ALGGVYEICEIEGWEWLENNFWTDVWMGEASLKNKSPILFNCSINKSASKDEKNQLKLTDCTAEGV